MRAAIYPGVDPRDAAQEIEACLQQKSRGDAFLSENPPEVEYNGIFARGYVLKEGSDAEQVLGQAHAASFSSSLESFVTPGYLDGRVFVLYDDCPCLVYGPVSHDIHAFDERVSLTSLQRVTGTIALLVANWCGWNPSNFEQIQRRHLAASWCNSSRSPRRLEGITWVKNSTAASATVRAMAPA